MQNHFGTKHHNWNALCVSYSSPLHFHVIPYTGPRASCNTKLNSRTRGKAGTTLLFLLHDPFARHLSYAYGLPSATEKQTFKKQYGSRAFSNSAPKLWNALPQTIREADSSATFHRRLKPHPFPRLIFFVFSVCLTHCTPKLFYVLQRLFFIHFLSIISFSAPSIQVSGTMRDKNGHHHHHHLTGKDHRTPRDVAQLAECRTGTPLTRRFDSPVGRGFFLPMSHLPLQTLLRFYTCHTTSGNGQAWSSASPRGQVKDREKRRKLIAKSSVVPHRPTLAVKGLMMTMSVHSYKRLWPDHSVTEARRGYKVDSMTAHAHHVGTPRAWLPLLAVRRGERRGRGMSVSRWGWVEGVIVKDVLAYIVCQPLTLPRHELDKLPCHFVVIETKEG